MSHFTCIDAEATVSPSSSESARMKRVGSLRVLVAIASFGSKNLEFLKKQIDCYQRMPFDVDVIVVSNNVKDLGPHVEVAVGLPIENPWSLPFAHKQIFSDRLDRYDLFIYSEDDIGVTEENITAFLEISQHLHDHEVAGFIRYEMSNKGELYFPDVFGQFHWDAASAQHRGPHTVARFTNEHAAFYILTKTQLHRAIASGGFLRSPYEGQYDMLCSAATDPYTSCGLTKVVCVSSLNKFLVHHLSNKYVGVMGSAKSTVGKQVEALLQIADGHRQGSKLFDVSPDLRLGRWGKNYYEPVNSQVIEAIPAGECSVLSIGCGWGVTERALAQRGATVTVLPLDAVIGALVEGCGIEVINGDIDGCLASLKGRAFDFVVIGDLLHLVPAPLELLGEAARFVAEGGALIVYGPYFGSLRTRIKQSLGQLGYRRFRSVCGLKFLNISPSAVRRSLRALGLRNSRISWRFDSCEDTFIPKLGVLSADSWFVTAPRA